MMEVDDTLHPHIPGFSPPIKTSSATKLHTQAVSNPGQALHLSGPSVVDLKHAAKSFRVRGVKFQSYAGHAESPARPVA
jgi:hypothetical protein